MRFLERIKSRAQSLRVEALTLGLAVGHRRTPWYAKLLVAGLVAYIVTPVDLVPDDVLAECRPRASEVVAGGRMRRLGRMLAAMLWSLAVLGAGMMVYYAL